MSNNNENQNEKRDPLLCHWADQMASQIIREKGDLDSYTCASGITPSGTVHLGNFREIITVDLVVRALRDRGKKVRFIYSWDDYDVFRKVPANMPDPEILEKYLRYPITEVPDTTGRNENYARHHEVDIETQLPRVGIQPEFLYQASRYRANRYAEGMRKAMQNRDVIKECLNEYRDDQHKMKPEDVFFRAAERLKIMECTAEEYMFWQWRRIQNRKGERYSFPYRELKGSKRIGLYGAGVVGRAYYRQICADKRLQLVGWYDISPAEDLHNKVELPNELSSENMEKIVIAVEAYETAEKIKKFLIEKGFEEGSIVWKI